MASIAPPQPLQPTYIGYVNTAKDALRLFEACLQGTLQTIQRRPHDRERSQLIRSGSVFIYSENNSSIKRWTDGRHWSPSRILGNFLVYRELEEPFPPGEKKRAKKKPKNRAARVSDPYPQSQRANCQNGDYSGVPARSPSDPNEAPERALIGSLVDSYGFKEGGLVKRTMSINVVGVHYHLVSYYTIPDVLSGRLQSPCKDPIFDTMEPRPELILRQNFRVPIDQPDQVIEDQHMGSMGGAYNYGYNPYRSTSMISQAALPPPQSHQQQQQQHHHGSHSAHHNHNLGMTMYGPPAYTAASSGPTAFQTVPLQASLPPSSSHYHYQSTTAIAPPPPPYSQYDSTPHAITLATDSHHPPAPSYQYGRSNWAPPPASISQSMQSRVGSIDTTTTTPTSDGKSPESEWQRHSNSGGYSALTSPISAQSGYGPPPTPWSAPPIPIRDDWPAYKTGQSKHEPHVSPHNQSAFSRWRQQIFC